MMHLFAGVSRVGLCWQDLGTATALPDYGTNSSENKSFTARVSEVTARASLPARSAAPSPAASTPARTAA